MKGGDGACGGRIAAGQRVRTPGSGCVSERSDDAPRCGCLHDPSKNGTSGRRRWIVLLFFYFTILISVALIHLRSESRFSSQSFLNVGKIPCPFTTSSALLLGIVLASVMGRCASIK